jgi:3-dehydroquinate dehydratase-1
MNSLHIKNIDIGNGKPKICLPIVGQTMEEIYQQAQSFASLEYDLVELRIDFFEGVFFKDQVIELLKQLREMIDKPILCTYRSLKEGGQIQFQDDEYQEFVQYVCESGYIDLIDIELMSGNELVYRLVSIAHQNHVFVVMSNHDFHQTPAIEEMKTRLEKMEILGGDILKMAVMPQSPQDVMNLLAMTTEMSHKLRHPIVTMSMGALGAVSRVCGELTGSAITFASAGKASAPGQIAIADMEHILEVLHYD